MVALIVILFPPLLIAFLLIMERVEEPLRRPTSQREVADVPAAAPTQADVEVLARSGIRRAMWRCRPRGAGRRRPRGRQPADGLAPTVPVARARGARDGATRPEECRPTHAG